MSNNFGVPSVSLLSEDAVASESGSGESELVRVDRGPVYLRGVTSTLQKGSRGSDSPVGMHRLFWGAHKSPSF